MLTSSSHFIEPQDRNQQELFSSLNDQIGSGNIVRIVDLVIESIVDQNPDRFYTNKNSSANGGRSCYDPKVMLKLFLYGYLESIRSSRKLEKATKRNIEVMWLMGKLSPDHKTIANYRKDNGDAITFLTREFRRFLKSNGFIKGQTVVQDGSKFKANAKRSMMTIKKLKKRMAIAEDTIADYLQQLQDNDVLESALQSGGADQSKEKALIDKIAFLEGQLEEFQNAKEVLEQ